MAKDCTRERPPVHVNVDVERTGNEVSARVSYVIVIAYAAWCGDSTIGDEIVRVAEGMNLQA